MLKAVFLLSEEAFASAYGPAVMARLRPQIDLRAVIVPGEQWRNQRAAVGQAEVIFAGWGAPRMDEDFFRAAPQVRAIFYAGGSVRYFVTDAMWQRNVRLTTAQASNAAPVAEYTLSAILLGLKRFWHYARLTRATRTFPAERPMPGAYGAEVGLISYGAIARLLRQKLAGFDVNVQVYDPFLTAEEAAREKVRKVSLDELCATCDVVSLHTPHLAETNGLLRARHFERMKPGAVFINTARGEIVHEAEMIAVLQRRPDLQGCSMSPRPSRRPRTRRSTRCRTSCSRRTSPARSGPNVCAWATRWWTSLNVLLPGNRCCGKLPPTARRCSPSANPRGRPALTP